MIKLPLDVLSFELQKSKLTDKISRGKCEYRDRLWNIWPVFLQDRLKYWKYSSLAM